MLIKERRHMQRTIGIERTYKLSEYNSLKVVQILEGVEDYGSEELVKQHYRYLTASVDKIALEYTQTQGLLRPLKGTASMEFLEKEQEEALTKIQTIMINGEVK
jgi:hypothetical protein